MLDMAEGRRGEESGWESQREPQPLSKEELKNGVLERVCKRG